MHFPWSVSVIDSVPLTLQPVWVRRNVCGCAFLAFCCSFAWLTSEVWLVLVLGRQGVLGATVLVGVRKCGPSGS